MTLLLDHSRYLDREMAKVLKQCAFLNLDQWETIQRARRAMEHSYEMVREAIRLQVYDPSDLEN